MSYRDSKSRCPCRQSNLAMAPGQGNDPRSLESESSVMPLDQPGVGVERIELSLPLYQSGVLTVRLYSCIGQVYHNLIHFALVRFYVS